MKSIALMTLGLAAVATSVQADVLLTIDVSNPAAVVFTATTGLSSDTGSTDAVNGFSLMSFFTSSANVQWLPTGGNLSVDGIVVNDAETDGLGIFGSGTNLVFARLGDSGNPSFSFTTGVQGLTGSVTIDMSFMDLPLNGSSGAINIGRQANGSLGAQIGTWQVGVASPVPEPASAAALVGLAAVGVAAMRRRQRQK